MRVVRNAKSSAGMLFVPGARFSAYVDSLGEPNPDSRLLRTARTYAARSDPRGMREPRRVAIVIGARGRRSSQPPFLIYNPLKTDYGAWVIKLNVS
jgi:hypothetical protein